MTRDLCSHQTCKCSQSLIPYNPSGNRPSSQNAVNARLNYVSRKVPKKGCYIVAEVSSEVEQHYVAIVITV